MTKSKRVKLISTLVVALLCKESFIKAQTIPDAGIWTTVNVELKVNPSTTLFLTEEVRTKEDFRRLDLFHTKAGIEYKLNNYLKVSFGYKFRQKFMPEGFFSYRHRLEYDVIPRKKIGNFIFSYRYRIQAEIKDFNSSETGHFPEWAFRNKLQIKYTFLKSANVYLSSEVRYKIFNPAEHRINNVRHQLGIDYKFNSNHQIGLYYLLEDEFNVKEPEDTYVIGFEWSIELN